MIRVLQVIGSMNRGGAETMLMNYYRHIDRTQIQFDFVENNLEKAAYDDEILNLGGKIYRSPRYNGKNHFQYIKWWNDFFREHTEYRIIHGHLGSTAAIYLSIAKKNGLFTIAHSHNTQTQINFNELIYKLYSYPTRWIADHFFSCSRTAGISRYGRKIGANPTRCTKVNNAIDTDKFVFNYAVRQHMRQLLKINDKTVIGHVGRFNHQKNHTFLIDIFREIHTMNPDTILLLIGDGTLRKSIEEKIINYRLQDHVIITGVVANISDYYQTIDVFVFPSLYEGLPVTLVEAQTSGLPCIISDKVPAESILIDDLVNVLKLSDPMKKWAEVILSQMSIPRTNRASEISAKGYDISTAAEWLGEFYRDKCR